MLQCIEKSKPEPSGALPNMTYIWHNEWYHISLATIVCSPKFWTNFEYQIDCSFDPKPVNASLVHYKNGQFEEFTPAQFYR